MSNHYHKTKLQDKSIEELSSEIIEDILIAVSDHLIGKLEQSKTIQNLYQELDDKLDF